MKKPTSDSAHNKPAEKKDSLALQPSSELFILPDSFKPEDISSHTGGAGNLV